jgi:hypothetical protein
MPGLFLCHDYPPGPTHGMRADRAIMIAVVQDTIIAAMSCTYGEIAT